ncbi:MAG: PulJ/GspJ family protein, partial [Bdellovibrionales bacterium]
MRVPLNQNGQSLVQVMVAAAIMGVIMMAMVSSQTMQSRENTALTEKLSSLDLQRSLTSAESNSASCSKLFDPANAVNPSDLTFDATSVTSAAPHIIPLKQIPGIGTAPPVLVQNSQPSSLSQNLFVPAGGIQVKVSSPTSATLVVGFDQTRLVRSIHNLELPLSLRSTGPLNATTAAGCQTGTSSGTSLFKVSDFNVMPMAVDMNAPDYHAVHYSVPIPTLPFDQLYAMMGVGIWDVTTCGSFGG